MAPYFPSEISKLCKKCKKKWNFRADSLDIGPIFGQLRKEPLSPHYYPSLYCNDYLDREEIIRFYYKIGSYFITFIKALNHVETFIPFLIGLFFL